MRFIIPQLLAAWCGAAFGFAPEAFESFALMKTESNVSIFSHLLYKNQNFTKSSQIYDIHLSYPTPSKDMVTLGASATVADAFGDKDAYFLRYDFTFYEATHSFSLKLAHEDWKYINTGKDTIGFEINALEPLGTNSGFYGIIGYYHRWLTGRYSDKWWVPFSGDTNDKEHYFTLAGGFKIGFGEESYATLDINVRDTYRYHHFDSPATDFALHIGLGENFYLRGQTGIRWTSVLSGSGVISEYYGGIGIASY